MHPVCVDPLAPYVRDLITAKVRSIIGQPGLQAQDLDDLRQEVYRHLLQQLPAFDPERGNGRTFVVMVVDRFVANLARNQQTRKRRPHASLDVRVATADVPMPWAELFTTIDARKHRKVDPRDEHDLAQLVADVAAALAKLPPDLRDLAERLTTQNVATVAQETGADRSTVASNVRRLRQMLEKTHLRDYLR